jgi:hypothetical protein
MDFDFHRRHGELRTRNFIAATLLNSQNKGVRSISAGLKQP